MGTRLGLCSVCENRAELFDYLARPTCEDCIRKGTAPRTDPTPEAAPAAPPSAAAVSGSERETYLETIKRADFKTRSRIIARLVRERVFHVEFDQVVANERWFSIMDLRRLALEVAQAEKSTNRRARCQTQNRRSTQRPASRSQTRTQQRPQPNLPERPLIPVSLRERLERVGQEPQRLQQLELPIDS